MVNYELIIVHITGKGLLTVRPRDNRKKTYFVWMFGDFSPRGVRGGASAPKEE